MEAGVQAESALQREQCTHMRQPTDERGEEQAPSQCLPRFANATDGLEEEGIGLSPDELAQALVEGPRKPGVAAIHPGKGEGGICDDANAWNTEKEIGGRRKIGVGVTTGR